MRYSQRPAYQQQQLLGKGSFAQVYKVRLQNKPYALKRIFNYHLKDPNYYKSIKRQIAIMQKLNHPNIVQLIDVYQTESSLQILLEYLPGGSLYDKIKYQDRLSQNLVRSYILDILKAIKYMHSFQQPILHRDIKPQNILISETGHVKLCDFGSANMIVPDHTRDSYVGTTEYMPKQMKQCTGHDQSLDLWCVGVLIYELLTGNLPNADEKGLIQFPDYISRPAQDLIKRILVEEQSKRMNLQQIQDHIWFVGCQNVPNITQFTFGANTLSTKDMVERIKSKNQSMKIRMSKKLTGNSIQSQISQMSQSSLVLTNSSSFMAQLAEENAQQYIQQLRTISKLQQEFKNNQNSIKDYEERIKYLRQLKQKNKNLQQQKIKQVKMKTSQTITHNQTSQKQCMNVLQTVIKKLDKLKQYAQYLPQFYKQKILTFSQLPQIQQKDIEYNTLPISQYLPKLKLKMLQDRRDALIQLKCIKKRRIEMSYMLMIQEDKYEYDADATTEQMLFRDRL